MDHVKSCKNALQFTACTQISQVSWSTGDLGERERKDSEILGNPLAGIFSSKMTLKCQANSII